MANIKYYPEDELVQKVQSGEYGWLDYQSPLTGMAGRIHRIL